MSARERPTAAFVLSLIAGLLILIGGVTRLVFRFLRFGGMMRGFEARWIGMMGFPGYAMMWGFPGYAAMWGFIFMSGILGLVLGVLMIVGAIMLNNRPQGHRAWGTVIVILSVLSFFVGAMGGFGINLILGLIGGVLAIRWKPTQTQPKT